jgi:hypothetical protein
MPFYQIPKQLVFQIKEAGAELFYFQKKKNNRCCLFAVVSTFFVFANAQGMSVH